jgi:hypothetical protein
MNFLDCSDGQFLLLLGFGLESLLVDDLKVLWLGLELNIFLGQFFVFLRLVCI